MITSRTCDKDDPNIILWIIHFTLSTYNVVNSLTYMYFALIFKLGEMPGGGGGGRSSIFSYICMDMAWAIFRGSVKRIFLGGMEKL